jgi:hypothetical protein
MCVLLLAASVEWGKGGRSSSAPEHQGARHFSLEELALATNDFSEANLVGAGSFGLVYKGLLLDGSVVAIKRRIAAPRQEFADEVSKQYGCKLQMQGRHCSSFEV